MKPLSTLKDIMRGRVGYLQNLEVVFLVALPLKMLLYTKLKLSYCLYWNIYVDKLYCLLSSELNSSEQNYFRYLTNVLLAHSSQCGWGTFMKFDLHLSSKYKI